MHIIIKNLYEVWNQHTPFWVWEWWHVPICLSRMGSVLFGASLCRLRYALSSPRVFPKLLLLSWAIQLLHCVFMGSQRHGLEGISGGHLVQPLPPSLGLLPTLVEVNSDFFISSWKPPCYSTASLGRWHLYYPFYPSSDFFFFFFTQKSLPLLYYFTIICTFSPFAICLVAQSA